jgi:hypothetical protein
VLTVGAALACAWWVERAAMKNERAALAAERELLHAKRRELDARFLNLVDWQDQINNAEARLNREQELAGKNRQ